MEWHGIELKLYSKILQFCDWARLHVCQLTCVHM